MTTGQRDRTVDVARGLAIIAIVLGHIDRGLGAATILDTSSVLYVWADRFLYSWHIVVFALLSGLFTSRSRERQPLHSYLRARLIDWLWLYLVWTVLQGVLKMAAGEFANQPGSFESIVAIWRPDGQLWFLPWIMLATTLASLLRPWRSTGMAVLVLTLSGVGAVAAWGYEGSSIGQQGLALYFFYLLGCVIGSARLLRVLSRPSPAAAWMLGIALTGIGAILALAHSLPPTSDTTARSVTSVTLGILMTVVSTAGVLVLSRALQPHWPGRALAYVGRHSMTIFLAHIISIAGTRAVLLRVGIDDPLVMIPVQLAVGVAAPLLLHLVSEKTRVTALIRAPRRLTGAAGGHIRRASARTH